MNFAPSGSHLLDTSAVILMMRTRVVPTRQASIPFAAVAELIDGVRRSNDPSRAVRRLEAVLGTVPVIYPDEQTLALYGRISAELRRRGQPIPVNDLWNAALAVQHDLPLLAVDAHFSRVPGLNVISVR